MIPPSIASATDALEAEAFAALGSRVAASTLRWTSACALAFAALLALSVALATGDRSALPDPAQPSASAYLDFDLAVLRALARRSLSAPENADGLRSLWARRPPWTLPSDDSTPARLVPLRDAWAASVADKSRFRAAARGAWDALGILIAGLSLALAAAAAAGAFAEGVRTRASAPRLALLGSAALGLVAIPLWPMLDPSLFYDRTRSLGSGLQAALFVAAFAGAFSGAAARGLFAPGPQAASLTALAGRPQLLAAARLSALLATRWLVPLLPALAAAAVFACAKADQDPSARAASGLGGLIRAAMREVSVAERLSSAALVGGALVVLWYLGHRFVAEVRASLRAAEGAG
ncbi:MAG TPA: hypothetical protein VMK66_15905 [Myxococcales bacterium]|nr:hypothetical protein [Myxococcales bacterium]